MAEISKELYDVLACPTCKGDVHYNDDKSGLVCDKCDFTYPIKDGIPIMLPKDMQEEQQTKEENKKHMDNE